MSMPVIDGLNRKKPLCYDPSRKRFIYFDDILSGQQAIVLPSSLSVEDKKRLVIERHRVGPDYAGQAMSGPLMNRNDMVRAIERDEEIGRTAVAAEVSYLVELLAEIKRNL
jgi:hypothetical protein